MGKFLSARCLSVRDPWDKMRFLAPKKSIHWLECAAPSKGRYGRVAVKTRDFSTVPHPDTATK